MMNQIEKNMLEQVINKEFTARWALDILLKRGVQINADPSKLTHEEVKQILWGIYEELERREYH